VRHKSVYCNLAVVGSNCQGQNHKQAKIESYGGMLVTLRNHGHEMIVDEIHTCLDHSGELPLDWKLERLQRRSAVLGNTAIHAPLRQTVVQPDGHASAARGGGHERRTQMKQSEHAMGQGGKAKCSLLRHPRASSSLCLMLWTLAKQKGRQAAGYVSFDGSTSIHRHASAAPAEKKKITAEANFDVEESAEHPHLAHTIIAAQGTAGWLRVRGCKSDQRDTASQEQASMEYD